MQHHRQSLYSSLAVVALVPTVDDVDTAPLDAAVAADAVGVADDVAVACLMLLLQLFSFASSEVVDYLQMDSAFGFRFFGNSTDVSSGVVHFLPPAVVSPCSAIRIPHYNPHAVV